MGETGRRVGLAIVLGVAGLGLMGMGGLGGGRDTGTPAHDFRATFTDVDGTRVDANRVTAGGDTSLEGDIGRGHLRVPFDNVSRVTFAPGGEDRDKLRATVQLRQGEPVTMTVRSSTTFYGQTPSGAYQIRARDLKSVDFGQ